MKSAADGVKLLEQGWPGQDYIRSAVRCANPNALRTALAELTGDAELESMHVQARPVRGGAMRIPALSPADRERVEEKAAALLAAGPIAPVVTSRNRAAELLRVFGSDVEASEALELALDELGFPNPDADLASVRGPGSDVFARRTVTIIGAGISAIALAIRLKRMGVPFRMIERQAGIGGTWQLNDYPEARVDITNFIYQFRFERNYPWPGLFAPQAEIKRYLEHIVAKYDLAGHIDLNVNVTAARWDDQSLCWHVALEREGTGTETIATDFLISAAGLFSTPNLPNIPGLEDFEGTVFHTTGWNHKIDLTDRRVALIGNGSSGVQLMPWLARTAGHLTVFQRSPNWITPVEDYRKPVDPRLHWLFRALPTYWHWHCYAMSALDKQVEDLQVENLAWRNATGGFNERNDRYRSYLESYIRDQLAGRPDLVKKCMPSFPPLARRMVVDSGWFEALQRDNVALVSHPIACVDPRGIITSDGERHDLDAIVLGTGFRASEFLQTVGYVGAKGTTLDRLWRRDGARAYLGMFLPGFPNFAVFYGPNGQPQSGSFHDWADRCARLVANLIVETAARNRSTFEVRPDVFDTYNNELDNRMASMIWGREGASGYYVNAHGRPITKMPWRAHEYYAKISDPSLDAFFPQTVPVDVDQ